jgi:Flp pilus assembly protein TadG
MKQSIHSLYRNQRGASIIEFALVAPILLLFIFAILEYGIITFTQSVVEGATTTAARTGKTGFTVSGALPTPQDRANTIRAAFASNSGSTLQQNNLKICAYAFSTFNANNPTECVADIVDPNIVPFNAGVGGEVTVYVVTYQWSVLTPILRPFFTSGTAKLTSITTVRNEGF